MGAGGLSNAVPELVDACERGAKLELRMIPTAEAICLQWNYGVTKLKNGMFWLSLSRILNLFKNDM